MASPLTSPTSDTLLPTIRTLSWHVPMLAWKARAQSGDLLSREPRRQRGAHARPFHGTRQLFGASHLAWSISPLTEPIHTKAKPFSKLCNCEHFPAPADLLENQTKACCARPLCRGQERGRMPGANNSNTKKSIHRSKSKFRVPCRLNRGFAPTLKGSL